MDQNPKNNNADNLAFLCFDHHDQYDSTTRQSKNLTLDEVRSFRVELMKAIAEAFSAPPQFTELASRHDDPIAGHYIRDGEYDSAEISVTALTQGRYHVSGHALWGKKREYGPNTGEVDFVATLSGNDLIYTNGAHDREPYRLLLRFSQSQLVASEEMIGGMFGMNVSFGGTYRRAT